MALTIRDAVLDDTRFLAGVMQRAARSHLQRGFWDLLLPGDERFRLGIIESIVSHPVVCHCHHSRFILAERDGEPAGALCGYEPRIHDDRRFATAVTEAVVGAQMPDEQLLQLEANVEPFSLCRPEFAEDSWIVEWVAVEPHHRGRGVVDALLATILERARDHGYRRAELAVLMGNVRAERAYHRAGFHTVAARTHPSLQSSLGTPGVTRMRIDL